MSAAHQHQLLAESSPAADLDTDVERAIELCGGDPRAAVRALLVSNNFLAAELERMSASVSRGYARGRLRQGADCSG